MSPLFLYLFIYWSCKIAALMLCYHSIATCTCKGDISALFPLDSRGWFLNLLYMLLLYRLLFAALAACPITLHSVLLYRGYWKLSTGLSSLLLCYFQSLNCSF